MFVCSHDFILINLELVIQILDLTIISADAVIDGVRNLTELNEEQRNNILCESPIAELCM